MYQKAGYQKTQVKYVLNIDENAGRGTVTFEITESPKVKILRVEFEGARAFKQKKLRKVIKTRRRWMFSWLTGSGKLKDATAALERQLIEEALMRNKSNLSRTAVDLGLSRRGLRLKMAQMGIQREERV